MDQHNLVRWLEVIFIILTIVAVWFSITNFSSVKRFLIGRPMRTKELHSQKNRLFWVIALAILSTDLYSSVAYGPEAGVTELVNLGLNAKWYILPITTATVLLLLILILSYIMGVIAYPSGGGAYAIARGNFKKSLPSLIASSSLLIDYVLTVAVSVSSGVNNIASAYPILKPFETTLAVLCIFILVIVNLRGVAEAARIFAWPTFLFMISMIVLIAVGLINEFRHGFIQNTTPPLGTVPQGLTTLLILKAFSAACSSLTGIETISNAVPIFREPRQKNAIKTYIALGLITGITLMGFSYHLYVKGISVNPTDTMLSQLAKSYFGNSFIYQIIIWTTFLVLILAANSTFTGFSQLSAIVASDGFLPRALANRGDRLGYSNGIILLAGSSSLLVIAFHAQTNALIPLFAIGVFLSFTVAQIGLLLRWCRVKGDYWRLKFTINFIGAIVSALVAIVFAVTKFIDGAWIVLVGLPFLIFFSLAIHRHYVQVSKELQMKSIRRHPHRYHIVSVVLISGIHRVVDNTISFAENIGTEVLALYIGFDDESIEKVKQKWDEWGAPCQLVTIRSEYRSILGPLSEFIKTMEVTEGKPDHIHIILPQFVTKRRWHNLLHNQSALLIRAWLLTNKDVVITTVPYHLNK